MRLEKRGFIYLVSALVAVYSGMLALRYSASSYAGLSGTIAFFEEAILDLLAIALSACLVGLSNSAPAGAPSVPDHYDRNAFRAVLWSFTATLISLISFQILSRRFGITLPKIMGTWLEIVVNVPYIAFFALGAAALVSICRTLDGRAAMKAGRVFASLAILLILVVFLGGLHKTGNPLQNRVIHMLCFLVSGIIFGFGLRNLLSKGASAATGLLSGGYMSMALSGLLFQATEIYPRVPLPDILLDLTWTAGQFAVVCGLFLFSRPAERYAPRLSVPA